MAKATGVVASQLQKDADLIGGEFNSRPYYRMFLGLICSLPANDPTDGNAFGMLSALSNTLALVQVGQALQLTVLMLTSKYNDGFAVLMVKRQLEPDNARHLILCDCFRLVIALQAAPQFQDYCCNTCIYKWDAAGPDVMD